MTRSENDTSYLLGMAAARTAITAVVVGGLLALIVALPALAHADLVSSDPPDKAVLATPPSSVTLTFSEALDATKSSFRLVGASGTIGTGQVAGPPTVMTLGGLSLGPGDYTIQWTSMSTDQHLLRGTLTFTVSASASPTSSVAPSAATPGGASASTSASPTPLPSATASPEEPEPVQAASSDVVLPILVALVLVAGVGWYVLRRSRRA